MSVEQSITQLVDDRVAAYHDQSTEELKEHIRDVMEAEQVIVWDSDAGDVTIYKRDTTQ